MWLRIAESGQGGIVMEDDSMLVPGRSYNVCDFPQDAITRLGGGLRTALAWSFEDPDFITNFKYYEILCSLEYGINLVPISKARFTNSIAYYVPVLCAQRLIDMVKNKKVHGPDIMLNALGDSWIWYPPPFVQAPGTVSQCGSPSKDQKHVYL